MLMALFASVNRTLQTGESWFSWLPGANLVFGFAALSTASGITSMLGPSGYTNLLYNELLSYKGWIDQFVFYFIALSCIRDKEMAKRMVVYMLIGSIVLVMYSVPEMLDKMGRSTIEKSRIEGPHKQSNNFGDSSLDIHAVFSDCGKGTHHYFLTRRLCSLGSGWNDSRLPERAFVCILLGESGVCRGFDIPADHSNRDPGSTRKHHSGQDRFG